MPTQSEIDAVREQIEVLIEERSFVHTDQDRISVAPHGRGTEAGFYFWSELTDDQQLALLTSEIGWLGFEASQIVEVSRRVAEGETLDSWFDGIAVTDRAERREELFTEMREEEYFRRHGEPPQPGDIEREADAVADAFPNAANDNAPSWRREFDAMIEALADPPNFRESWTEADKLRVIEETWDWTGADDRQKEAMLTGEVDFARITRDELNAVYEAIGSDEIDERPARRLFDEANYARAVVEAERMDFGEQIDRVRPATRHLIESVALDAWPRAGTIVDFGIDSQAHYEALYYPICNNEIAPIVLDAAMGNGARLTEMVREAASNPHKDIEFNTSWDVLLGREKQDPAGRDLSSGSREKGGESEYEKAVREAADMAASHPHNKGKDGPER